MLDSGALVAGRYEIVAPLASGGSGLVYAATDRTTEKRVAIKVLGPHVLHERAAREKLRLEAIVAGRVESEHIVQVWDAGVDGLTGFPYLVMELLRGHDLQHWVEQRGPLESAVAVEYLRQVASGLDKAHSWKDSEQRPSPIVHRDLKPENLFLTHREDGSPLVKILDFGLAKVISGSATLSTEVRGTPLYMAPEQLSQAPVTPATDIWSLGLIAFFFLTGKCYWRSGQGNTAVLHAVLKEVGEGPTDLPQSRLKAIGVEMALPAAFDDWFLRCVNLEPARRFPTAGQAVRALSLALGLPQPSSPLAGDVLPSAPRHERVESEREAQPAAAVTIRQRSDSGDSRKRHRTLVLPVVLGIVVLGSLVAIIDKSPRQPAPLPSDAASAIGTETAGHPAVTPASRDAQAEPSEAAAATPLPSRSQAVALPNPPQADSLRTGTARSALPVALKQSMQTAPKMATPPAPSSRIPIVSSSGSASATATEPTATPRARRDPADHR